MPLFLSIKSLIIYIYIYFFFVLDKYTLELDKNPCTSKSRSPLFVLSSPFSLSHTLYFNVFLFLSRNQSCSFLVRHHFRCCHGRCRSNISLSKFLLVSLFTTTPTFLTEISYSFSLYNHINLFKIKVAILYFVDYATIVVAGVKSLCWSFF